MSQISKLKDRLRGFGGVSRSGSSRPAEGAKGLPLDHQLVFNRNPKERWSYDEQDGHIYVNGEEVEALIESSPEDVRFQSAVSEAVDEYRESVRGRGDPRFAKLSSKVEGIQTKILGNMKRIYDEKTGGMSLRWGDAGLLFNRVDVRRVLAMYHLRPTPQAQRFLKGLLANLNLLLVRRNDSPHISKIVRSLCEEVSSAINTTPINAPYLTSGSGNSDC